MRASQYHSVYPCLTHGIQVILYDFLCHMVLLKAFLDQRHEKRTRLLQHGNIRRHLADDLGVHPPLHRRISAHDTHLPVMRRLHRRPRAGDDNTKYGQVKFLDVYKRQRQDIATTAPNTTAVILFLNFMFLFLLLCIVYLISRLLQEQAYTFFSVMPHGLPPIYL